MTIPIGLQLYSIRDECKDDLAGSLKQVAAMGYQGVEFAGFHDHAAADVKAMLDDVGLRCCGSHVKIDLFAPDKIEQTIEYHQTIGCAYLIVPGIPEPMRADETALHNAIADFIRIREALQPHGQRTGYHAHFADAHPVAGKPVWEHIADGTPDDFILQMDTGNYATGGGDPVETIRQYPRRATTVHLKPYSSTREDALIGEDQLDWQAIFDASENVGHVEWYIIEYEHKTTPPMEAVHHCLTALQSLR